MIRGRCEISKTARKVVEAFWTARWAEMNI
jgi:hypothetical protein